jgi:hypothetical protein
MVVRSFYNDENNAGYQVPWSLETGVSILRMADDGVVLI